MIVLLSLGSNANVSNACIEQNPVRPQELSAQGRKLEVAIRAGAAAMLGLKEFECMGWISWRWRLWIHGAAAFERAFAAVDKYGGASTGRRTLLDAFLPASSTL